MKRFNRLFQDAERLAPPPDLWKRIEAASDLAPGTARGPGARKPETRKTEAPARKAGGPEPAVFWGAPALRAAAAVVLAVGVLGLGVMLQKRTGGSAAYADSAAAQKAAQKGAQKGGQENPAGGMDRESEMVDPELLGWHADLGELNDEVVEAEEAEEML